MRIGWLRDSRVLVGSVIAAMVLPITFANTMWAWGWISWGNGCFGMGHFAFGQFVVGDCVSRYAMWWQEPALVGVWKLAVVALGTTLATVLLPFAWQRPGGRLERLVTLLWVLSWAVIVVGVALSVVVAGVAPGPGLLFGVLAAVGLVLRQRGHETDSRAAESTTAT